MLPQNWGPLFGGSSLCYGTCLYFPPGAYERGTVTLVNGEAEVTFSETFGIVANPETLTIMTSAWSAESKGLAVIERTERGFKIKEFGGGTGNYKVDWEAKAVRKGWEDFEVVQDVEKEEDLSVAEEEILYQYDE